MTHSIWRFFTSLRLTVVLLALSTVLVFLGTIAQVHEGLWNAQDRWFRSVFVLRQKGDPLWLPPIFPGGYFLGIMLLLNLIAAHIKRFAFIPKKIGIHFTHLGVILLLVGQLTTDFMARESILAFKEGETKEFSEATRKFELAFIRSADDTNDEIVAIPDSMLQPGQELAHASLPFKVRVKEYWINSEPAFRAPMQQNAPPLTDKGIASDFDFKKLPEAKGMDDRNLPAVIVEITSREGQPLGTWIVPSWPDDEAARDGVRRAYTRSVGPEVAESIMAKFSAPQTIEAGGSTWRMAMRPERYYKGFKMTLLKTTHETYRGTDIPKNFQSRVRIENSATGENREVDIYMNNPLRYEGLTFYQSTMGRDEVQEVGRSGLQVVRNPSWLTPYAGCIIVWFGMTWQFLYHLIGFLGKRRTDSLAGAAKAAA
jgi:hypothetical protein